MILEEILVLGDLTVNALTVYRLAFLLQVIDSVFPDDPVLYQAVH